MPNLKSATTPPADMSNWVQVDVPASRLSPPPAADQWSQPGYESLSLAPAPPILSTDVDRQRQFYRRGVSQYRIPPLPTKANPSINASARTIATQVVAESAPSGGGLSAVGLTMPVQFAVTNSPVTESSADPNLHVAWVTEPVGTYLGVPSVVNAPYPDNSYSNSQYNVSTLTTAFDVQANDLCIYMMCSTPNPSVNPNGPTGGSWTRMDNASLLSLGFWFQKFTSETLTSQTVSFTKWASTTTPALSQAFVSLPTTGTPVVTELGHRTGNLTTSSTITATVAANTSLMSICAGDANGFANSGTSTFVMLIDSKGNLWFPITVTFNQALPGTFNSSTFISVWFCPNPQTGSTTFTPFVNSTSSGGSCYWGVYSLTNLANSNNLPQFKPILASDMQGILGVPNGGTGSALVATGGFGQVVKQTTTGGALSGAALDYNELLGTNAPTNFVGQSVISPGFPYFMNNSSITNRTSAISGQNISSASGISGLCRISWTAKVTTPATVSSTLGGTNGFQIQYTDAQDNVVVTTPAWWGCGNNGAAPASASLNTTQTFLSGSIVIFKKSGTSILYNFDYTSSGGTPMAYYIQVKTEMLT